MACVLDWLVALAIAHGLLRCVGPFLSFIQAAWMDNLHPLFCSCKQMRSSIGAIGTGPEASHRLLHIVVNENFRKQHLVFASKWVAEEFAKKALSDELQVGQQFPRVGSHPLLGFEQHSVHHGALPPSPRGFPNCRD